jgi:hypothetical protein
MVQHRNNPLLDFSIHPLSYAILLRTVRSHKFASDAAFPAKLDELVRFIVSSVIGS